MLPLQDNRRTFNGVRKPEQQRQQHGESGRVGSLCSRFWFRWQRHALVALLLVTAGATLWMQSTMLSPSFSHGNAVVSSPLLAEAPTALDDALGVGDGNLRLEKTATPGPVDPSQPASASTSTTTLASSSNTATTASPSQEQRRLAVKKAMYHAWSSYETHAFGADEVGPVSGRRKEAEWGNISCSMVDALDTLWIMDMKDEFYRARDYVAAHLQFGHLGGNGEQISVFETIIREVGGLLSAFDLSGEEIFKTKAQELMDLLLPAFEPNQSVFYTYLNPQTREKGFASWARDLALIADIGSLQLETRYLSDITGDAKYAQMGDAFYEILKREGSFNGTGLFPVHYDPTTGQFAEYSSISIGAFGDSFYEYLIKVYIYSGKRTEDAFLRRLYDEAVRGMAEYLLTYSKPDKLHFLQKLSVPGMHGDRSMDHLLCFVPGMLALGTLHEHKDQDKNARHLDLATKLMETCYEMYHRQKTGLSPDVVEFPNMISRDAKYKLRPEAVESLFYLYRVTKDNKYRDQGWEIFQSLEKHAKATFGYGAVVDVRHVPAEIEDKMESFFLAETLKYHYLLQASEDLIPLDEYVFNTEAHPLRIRKR